MQAVLSYVQKRRSGNLLGSTPSPFNSYLCPKQGKNKAHSGKMHPQKQQIKPRQNRIYKRFIVAFLVVGVARLELAASCSQSRRATNCATPRHPAALLHRREIVYRFFADSSTRNLSGRGPSILLCKTVRSLKSPTGAFIAALRSQTRTCRGEAPPSCCARPFGRLKAPLGLSLLRSARKRELVGARPLHLAVQDRSVA